MKRFCLLALAAALIVPAAASAESIEGSIERGRGEAKPNRLRHEASPGEADRTESLGRLSMLISPYPVSDDASCSFMNNPG